MKPQPPKIYHPANDHFDCYFICGRWQEPILPGRWRKFLAALGVRVRVRFETKYGNQVIDVPPVFHALQMQPHLAKYVIVHAMPISRKLYNWTQDLIKKNQKPDEPAPETETKAAEEPNGQGNTN